MCGSEQSTFFQGDVTFFSLFLPLFFSEVIQISIFSITQNWSSELCGLVPWLLNTIVMFCKLK